MFKRPKRKSQGQDRQVQRIISSDTDFNTIETYKAIRTNIMFSLPKKEGGKVICVTSSVPGEGKTTSCVNMAITFAQTGTRVVVVDCDMRKARVHRYLKTVRGDGVSNILCGFSTLDKAVKKDVRENLDVLTAGEIPPNPAELLGTKEFENLINTLKERYDYIFIDTPPVTVVTDAVVITKLCDGIVVVARANHTTYDMMDETKEILERVEKQVLGVVLVGVEGDLAKYGHYRKKNYKYNYGDKAQ